MHNDMNPFLGNYYVISTLQPRTWTHIRPSTISTDKMHVAVHLRFQRQGRARRVVFFHGPLHQRMRVVVGLAKQRVVDFAVDNSALAYSLLPNKWLSSKSSRDASTRLACRIEGGLDGSTGHPWRIGSRCRHRWKISCDRCRSVALVRFRGSGPNHAVTRPGVCGFVCTQLASPAALGACNSLFHPAIYGQPPAQVKGAAVGPAARCESHWRMSQHSLTIRLELVQVGMRKRKQTSPYQKGFAVVTIRVM